MRLVNPTDGPLGEEPGWRGFAQPGLQARWSPLLSTAVLAVLVAGWHVPLFFLEDGGLQPPVLVGGLVATVAVTFWYAWLFNRTGGSVLLVLMAHSVEGSLPGSGLDLHGRLVRRRPRPARRRSSGVAPAHGAVPHDDR